MAGRLSDFKAISTSRVKMFPRSPPVDQYGKMSRSTQPAGGEFPGHTAQNPDFRFSLVEKSKWLRTWEEQKTGECDVVTEEKSWHLSFPAGVHLGICIEEIHSSLFWQRSSSRTRIQSTTLSLLLAIIIISTNHFFTPNNK